MDIKSTKNSTSNSQFIKILVYGQAGVGKTYLCTTLPNPFILSAEAGLVGLSDVDIPYWDIKSITDLNQAFTDLKRGKNQYRTIVLDSLSEIAEISLAAEKVKNKDGRQAYMVMQEQVTNIIRAFRELPYNIYMTARIEKAQDEMGRMLYSPAMPGQKIAGTLPYYMDEVLALTSIRDEEGKLVRKLQCQPDGLWLAKDRSGKLDAYEPADLGAIINKISGGEAAIAK